MLLACCMIYALVGYCQEVKTLQEKPIVFVDYLKRTRDTPRDWVNGLRNAIIEGLHSTGRIELVDVDMHDDLKLEPHHRYFESSLADDNDEVSRLTIMQKKGAQYIITGQVTSMIVKWKKEADGSRRFEAAIKYILRIINPENGALIGTKELEHSGVSFGKGASEDAAITNTYQSAAHSMRDFVDTYFKIEGTILEVSSEKKGKAEEVYINLGAAHGMKEAQKFTVYVIRDIAGRQAKKEVGRLTIKSVDGDDISLCKVQKGGQEILDAIQNKYPIQIVSREQTFMGGLLH